MNSWVIYMILKRLTKKLLILMAVILFISCLPAASFAQTDSAEKSVRVGYFTMENFMEGGSDGSVQSGFTYELLCEIAAYNHWDIEYIYGDFSDLYKQLEQGNIDILPNVIDTEERREQVLFHSLAINTEHYYVSALTDDVPDGEVQPAFLNGKRLATVKDAFEEKYFDEWAAENGVSMEKVYCSGFDEAWEFVRAGKADCILNINNTAPDSGFVSLFEVGQHGVYFAVAKDRADIIADIDYALKMIEDISPFLISQLQQKYLNDALSSYRLSKEEEDWVNSHSVLRIGFLKNDSPYAFEDGTGAVVGTYVDLTNLILEKLSIDSLRVEWTPYGSIDELRGALKNNKLDLICPEYHSYSLADRNGLAISEKIMDAPMGYLTLPSLGSDGIQTIATGGTRPGFDYVAENFPGADVVAYDTVDELVRAVSKHEADAAIAHIFALQESIRNNKSDFILSPLSKTCEICYAALEQNHELIMLMNRGHHMIAQDEMSSMDFNYTSVKSSRDTAKDFFRENMTAIIFALLAVIAIILFAVNRAFISRKLKGDLDEITRQNEVIEASRWELETAEETLKEKNVYLEYFLKSFNSAYVVDLKNSSFEILHMSPDFQKVFTMDGEKDAMDAFIDDHIHPDDRELMRRMADGANVMHLLETQNELSFTVREVFDDIVKTMRVFIVRGVDNTRATVAFMDISGELEKEKENSRRLEAANRAKSTFLFNMSHDIRTPMNAIIGFNNIALNHIDDKRTVLDSLHKVDVSSRQLLALINDVLDMARIESGEVSCEFAPTDIVKASADLIAIVRQSTTKALTVETDFSAVKHRFAMADVIHLNSILTNVISNSVKYTPEGGIIRFTVSETPSEKKDAFAYGFIIEDNGIGMSEEFLAHIFEEFSREKTSTASGIQGTGLGMPITKRLTELLGGTISIESRLGEGTKTTICLEMQAADENSLSPESAGPVVDKDVLKGKKVLLVEDNELNREIAEDILSEAGLVIDAAEDGDIAVEKMKRASAGQYDLILMDIQMPRMNGYEATRAIRALPVDWASSIPIVAMTANAFEEDKQNAFASGMNGHLAKPIEIPKLMETLSKFL